MDWVQVVIRWVEGSYVVLGGFRPPGCLEPPVAASVVENKVIEIMSEFKMANRLFSPEDVAQRLVEIGMERRPAVVIMVAVDHLDDDEEDEEEPS